MISERRAILKPNLRFPAGNINEMQTLELDQNVVIIGANGSGKTRLGAKLEAEMPVEKVHRVSAQRALTIPDFAPLKFLEQAQNELFFGVSDIQQISNKMGYRWGNNPATTMMSDFERVLSTLFAKHQTRNEDYVDSTKEVLKKGEKDALPIPTSPIEQLIHIWDLIYPQRKIQLLNGRVQVTTHASGSHSYHGKEMSDGERVALYLIGQCLCALPETILILDEPEIHLHRSIMNKLWDTLEEFRSDCLFVYITHDLEFAASRIGAKKFWIKEYDGNWWEIEGIPEIRGVPEELVMTLVGNRKKILFTEGDKGSLDVALYQALYPNYFVVPRGGCDKVIESTKAVRGTHDVHHLEAYGIIDRDFKTDEELASLQAAGVHSHQVAEIENLLIVEEVVTLMAEIDGFSKEEIFPQGKTAILRSLAEELENQISLRSAKEIEFRLNTFDTKAKGKEALKQGITNLVDRVNVDEIYDLNEDLYMEILDSLDYAKGLRHYNRKSLLRFISSELKMSPDGYKERFLRRIRGTQKGPLLQALKTYTPELP
jgi:ABC-type dipeptide/oligopeptide/nickel transport system ATPase component